MIPSYENFIDDINFINKEEYIENISIEAKENILMFNDLYKLIEEEEKKKWKIGVLVKDLLKKIQ